MVSVGILPIRTLCLDLLSANNLVYEQSFSSCNWTARVTHKSTGVSFFATTNYMYTESQVMGFRVSHYVSTW